MRHFLIDTDTGSDDAVALILALDSTDIQVEAITVVAGNVPLAQGVQNALYTVELCGKSVPVYAGASSPLERPLETAQFVHGEDGMGDIGLELKGRKPAEGHAVDVLIETANRFAGQLELVTLGPLTNIALALERDPVFASKIKLCSVMGGVGYGHGNITPVSEYNIWTDPEAAARVFESGLAIRMVGWDISRNHAAFSAQEAARLRSIGTELAHFAIDIQSKVAAFSIQSSQLPGFDLPDPIAMAIALDESIVEESKQLYVEVICAEGLTRGQTVVDHTRITGKTANIEVVLRASRKRFIAMLEEALRGE